MVINTNIGAMVSQRNLAESTNNLQRSLSRLATGSKIVQPQDDAAGLAMAARLDARLKRIDATRTSLANAISFTQTRDGYLGKIQSALERMSELATMAMDGTKSVDDIKLYMNEYNALRNYIQTGLSGKAFNGVQLFGSDQTTVYSDEDATDSGKINLQKVDLVSKATIANGVVTSPGGSINPYDLEAAAAGNSTGQNPTIVLSGQNKNTEKTVVPTFDQNGLLTSTHASYWVDDGTNKAVAEEIKFSLTQVTAALGKVTSQRADLGANLATLNFATDTLSVLKENVAAATSRIRDVDVADESASYARYSILVQAGTAMLAQANVIPQTALRLLS